MLVCRLPVQGRSEASYSILMRYASGLLRASNPISRSQSTSTYLTAWSAYRPSSSSATPKPPSARKSRLSPNPNLPRLSLEHFLIRQRVIKLYRTIIRGLQTLPKKSGQREDLRLYARGEFERHRNVTDASKIRYLVSTGKTEYDSMTRYLYEMGGRR